MTSTGSRPPPYTMEKTSKLLEHYLPRNGHERTLDQVIQTTSEHFLHVRDCMQHNGKVA